LRNIARALNFVKIEVACRGRSGTGEAVHNRKGFSVAEGKVEWEWKGSFVIRN
jgi:hypothetical protein